MTDVTVSLGKPKVRSCPHFWRKLREDKAFLELKCASCGDTQMLAWGRDLVRRDKLLQNLKVEG